MLLAKSYYFFFFIKAIHYFARRCPTPENETAFRDALETLLKYGCQINAPNIHGETPLHSAILRANLAMLQLLTDFGADLRATTA